MSRLKKWHSHETEESVPYTFVEGDSSNVLISDADVISDLLSALNRGDELMK